MFINKSTILWNQYLQQTTFFVRVRIHATTEYSSYYLIFGRHLKLSSDNNQLRPLDYDDDVLQERLDGIEKM